MPLIIRVEIEGLQTGEKAEITFQGIDPLQAIKMIMVKDALA